MRQRDRQQQDELPPEVLLNVGQKFLQWVYSAPGALEAVMTGERQPVESSCIASAGFSITSSMLEIQFVRDGSVYQYLGVSPTIYLEFLQAPSLGQYFNAEIRDRYGSYQA